MTRIKNLDTGISYGLFVMFLTHILVHSAGGLYTTLSPLIKNEFNLSIQQIGMIGAIPALCQFLIGIPSGLISDRIGPKRIIALSIIMAAVGSFIASISLNPWVFILALILVTLNVAIYHPPAFSYTANSVGSQKLSIAMGIISAGGMLGITAGPLSITLLMDFFYFSWRQVYLFWVIPILLSLIAIFFLKLPTESQTIDETLGEKSPSSNLITFDMITFLISGAIRTIGRSMTVTFLSIYLSENKGWSLGLIGVLYGVSNLLGVLASPIGGFLGSKFGEKKFMEITLFLSYLLFITTFFTTNSTMFVILYSSYSFFNLLSLPADSSIIANLSPKKRRGMGFAISFLPGNFARIIAPLMAAYIGKSMGIFTIFLVSSMFHFLGLAVLRFFVKLR
ncbi:MFS transporter [Thermoproteota archaeon]